MPRTELGRFGTVLRDGGVVDARNIRGGTITAQELVLAGGTQGVLRSQNFSITNETGWAAYGDGSAYFYGAVTLGDNATITGDLYSSNWNGTIPANLASVDGSATVGYYLDSSVGSGQLMGDLFVGGNISLLSGGEIKVLNASDVEVGALVFSGTLGYAQYEGDFRISGELSTDTTVPDFTNPAYVDVKNIRFPVGAGLIWVDQEGTDNDGSFLYSYSGGAGHNLILDPPSDVASANTLAYNSLDDSWTFGAPSAMFHIDQSNDHIIAYDDFFFNARIHTGGTSFTEEPWSTSTIELGNYGAVGTHGSFRASLDWNWERGTDSGFYNKAVNSYSEMGSVAIGHTGILFMFEDNASPTTNPATVGQINQDALRMIDGNASTPSYSFTGDTDTGIYRRTTNSLAIVSGGDISAYFVDGGSGSSLFLQSGLTDVGNHETLRLDRGSGTTDQAVGYYSSWINDPETGAVRKADVKPLNLGKIGKWWNRNWFMDLEPIKYRRVRHKAADYGKGKQIEMGFSIENLIEHTPLLTAGGDQVKGTPDEFALLAVTVDYVQHLEDRVAALEEKVAALI